MTDRIAQMYALYLEGKTLEEVAKTFHITRARVGQLFKDHGLKTRTAAETAALRNNPVSDERIIELYKKHGSVDAVLEHIDVSRSLVSLVVSEIPDRESYQRRRQDSLYTREDYLSAIKKAAEAKGEPLTTDAYREAAHELGLPSFTAILRHFDDRKSPWRDALRLAGVESNQPRREYTSISAEECIEAVVQCAREMGERPTYHRYCAWAQTHNQPSGSTVRNRVGWNAAVKEALDRPDNL